MFLRHAIVPEDVLSGIQARSGEEGMPVHPTGDPNVIEGRVGVSKAR